MSGPEVLIPLVSSVCMFVTIFGIVYMRNRENMALIERGINPRQAGQRPRFYTNLKYGLLILGSGLGLLTAFFFDQFLDHKAITPGGEVYQKDFPQVYFAMVAIGGGLGLVISYIMERKGWESKKTTED